MSAQIHLIPDPTEWVRRNGYEKKRKKGKELKKDTVPMHKRKKDIRKIVMLQSPCVVMSVIVALMT